MAEWGEDFRHFTPDKEDGSTFDLSQINNNFGKNLCLRCKTNAQMSSSSSHQNEFSETSLRSETVCLSKDCPGKFLKLFLIFLENFKKKKKLYFTIFRLYGSYFNRKNVTFRFDGKFL